MADVPAANDGGIDDSVQEEYHVSAADAGAFLIDLEECLQAGDDVTLSSTDWELPFAYRDPVELEIEYVGGPDAELEIEIELSGGDGGESPPSL
ncbi:MAG: amphi-Trp domain-containing protein, partial [Haloplanus sp.]